MNTDESVVHSHMGLDAYVSPVITLEPLRRKFHTSPTIHLPLPGFKEQGTRKMDSRAVHVLLSVTGRFSLKTDTQWTLHCISLNLMFNTRKFQCQIRAVKVRTMVDCMLFL